MKRILLLLMAALLLFINKSKAISHEDIYTLLNRQLVDSMRFSAKEAASSIRILRYYDDAYTKAANEIDRELKKGNEKEEEKKEAGEDRDHEAYEQKSDAGKKLTLTKLEELRKFLTDKQITDFQLAQLVVYRRLQAKEIKNNSGKNK